MTTVVFACVHNAGRSQMAAALFNLLANPALDLSGVRPRLLTDDLARSAQVLVTMGCGEVCPIVQGVRRLDWPLPDPKGLPLQEVRKIRDEIRSHVLALITENGWQRH